MRKWHSETFVQTQQIAAENPRCLTLNVVQRGGTEPECISIVVNIKCDGHTVITQCSFGITAVFLSRTSSLLLSCSSTTVTIIPLEKKLCPPRSLWGKLRPCETTARFLWTWVNQLQITLISSRGLCDAASLLCMKERGALKALITNQRSGDPVIHGLFSNVTVAWWV